MTHAPPNDIATIISPLRTITDDFSVILILYQDNSFKRHKKAL